MRDGRPYSPSGLREVEILSGVPEACQRLRRDGFLLVVVTIQPEVARGHLTRQTVEEIHGLLRSRIPLDAVRVCYHDDLDGCDCRKPRSGMLLAAARGLYIDLSRRLVVGVRWLCIEVGRRGGRTTF